MPYSIKFPVGACLVSLLIGATAATLHAQPAKPQIPSTPPNLTLTVIRQTGTCPQQVSLWTAFRYYEGGGEHTVIADTRPIAQAPAVLVKNGTRLVQYRVPLKPMYASCFAQATSQEDSQYRVRFARGLAYFEVDLSSIDKPPSNPAAITYRAVLTGRPYVRWAIAD